MEEMRKEKLVPSTTTILLWFENYETIPLCMKKMNFAYATQPEDKVLQKYAQNIRIYESEIKQFTIKERFEIAETLYKLWKRKVGNKLIYYRFCAVAFNSYIISEDDEAIDFWLKFGMSLNEIDKINDDQWCLVWYFLSRISAQSKAVAEYCWQGFLNLSLEAKLWCEYLIVHDIRKRMVESKDNIKIDSKAGVCWRILQRLLYAEDFTYELRHSVFRDENSDDQVLICRDLDEITSNARLLAQDLCNDKSKVLNKCINLHHRAFIIKTEKMDNYNIYGDFQNGFEYKRYVHMRNIPDATRSDYKLLNKYFPYTSDIDKQHMTTNLAALTYALLHPSPGHPEFQHFNYGERLANMNRVLKQISLGTNQVLVCTILILVLGHTEGLTIQKKILDTKYLLLSDINKRKVLKEFSTAVRRTQRHYSELLNAEQISALCYLELCFGRSEFTSDWHREIKNRCGDTIHIQMNDMELDQNNDIKWILPEEQYSRGKTESEEYYKRFREHAKIIAQQLVPTRPVTEDFRSFCERRHEWVVEGGTGGEKIEIDEKSYLFTMMKSKEKKKTIRVDKRAFMEHITIEEMLKWLSSLTPEELAKAFEKYENSKPRAIYGVSIIHYTINTYCTFGFEERMHHVDGLEKGVSGMTEYAHQNFRAKLCAGNEHHMTMLDFADFNRHHTPKSMAIIFEEFANIGEERNFHPDWIRANRWIAESKYNAWFYLPGDNEKYPANQGMFSGTKSTDLINTIENLIYYRIAKDLVLERYKIEAEDLYSVHQGDDIWISNKKRHFGAALYYVMNAQGYEFQVWKQMFSDSWGEYLRVLYHPKGGTGYAVRGLVNYILKPLYNEVIYNIASEASSLNDTYYTLQRRGMQINMLNTLWECDLIHRLRVISHTTDRKPIRLPSYVIQTPTYLGGLGATRPGHHLVTKIKLPSLPILNLKERKGDDKLKTNMTNDWISRVSRELPNDVETINAPAIRTALKDINYLPIYKKYKLGVDLETYKEEWSKWLEVMRIYGNNSYVLPSADFQLLPIAQNPDIHFIEGLYGAGTSVIFDITNFLNIIKSELEFLPMGNLAVVFGCGKLLKRIFAASVFKDVSMTARALGVSEIMAMSWITEYIRDNSLKDSDDMVIISRMIREHRIDLINFISSNSFGIFASMKGHLHPAILLECSNVAKEILVKSRLNVEPDRIEYDGYDHEYVSLSIQLLKIIFDNFDLLNIMY